MSQTPGSVLRIWTRKKMVRAADNGVPLLVDLSDETPPPSPPPPESPPPLIPPIFDSANGRSPGSAGRTSRSSGQDGPIASASAFPVFNYRGTNTVHGKLFLKTQAGGSKACSGTAVLAANHATVLTAGHCLYGTDRKWRKSVNFVPAYKEGSTPFGKWAATILHVTPGWRQRLDASEDVGVVTLARDGDGFGLQDVVGGLPVAFNTNPNEYYVSHGYPGKPSPPFNGQLQWLCGYPGGLKKVKPAAPMIATRQMLQITCDQSKGASGGGWVIGFPGSGLQLVSDHSVGSQTKRTNSGPYFDNSIKTWFQHEATTGPRVPRCAGREATQVAEYRGIHFLFGAGKSLTGTDGRDVMVGGNRNDTLSGGASDDFLCGGTGDDKLFGGPGRDTCAGDFGNDTFNSCEVVIGPTGFPGAPGR